MLPILWSLVAALVVAWLLGVSGVYALGAFAHVFLLLALVVLLVNLLLARRALG